MHSIRPEANQATVSHQGWGGNRSCSYMGLWNTDTKTNNRGHTQTESQCRNQETKKGDELHQ